jgi:hypothetical protein
LAIFYISTVYLETDVYLAIFYISTVYLEPDGYLAIFYISARKITFPNWQMLELKLSRSFRFQGINIFYSVCTFLECRKFSVVKIYRIFRFFWVAIFYTNLLS